MSGVLVYDYMPAHTPMHSVSRSDLVVRRRLRGVELGRLPPILLRLGQLGRPPLLMLSALALDPLLCLAGREHVRVLAPSREVALEPLHALLLHHGGERLLVQPLARREVFHVAARAAEANVEAACIGAVVHAGGDAQRVVGPPVHRIDETAAAQWPTLGVAAARPLPHVAHRVEESVAVGRVRVDRRGAGVAILRRVLVGEGALPAVHRATVLVAAPREGLVVDAPARGKLPLELGRQPQPRPLAVGRRVVPRDVHGWVALAPLSGRARPLGRAPVGAEHGDPVRRVQHATWPVLRVGRRQRGRVEEVRHREGPAESLRLRPVARRLHEAAKLRDADRRDVDQEGFDALTDRAP
mmetsp:Transcript_22153/g.56128  ORF Transcript_22153/g.56128 Transcript_22153/m.56128 type:complete len:355 (-) Transcript_22153:33-1097(-)